MTPPLTRYRLFDRCCVLFGDVAMQVFESETAIYLAADVDAELAARDETLEPLRRDSEILRKACIIEIAVANESGSVSEYMNHWEGRALKAEGALERLRAAQTWQPIATAPKDGTLIDVWLGDSDSDDVEFYCTKGTRRSPAWQYRQGKFRPHSTLGTPVVTVVPTHWMPLPSAPERS